MPSKKKATKAASQVGTAPGLVAAKDKCLICQRHLVLNPESPLWRGFQSHSACLICAPCDANRTCEVCCEWLEPHWGWVARYRLSIFRGHLSKGFAPKSFRPVARALPWALDLLNQKCWEDPGLLLPPGVATSAAGSTGDQPGPSVLTPLGTEVGGACPERSTSEPTGPEACPNPPAGQVDPSAPLALLDPSQSEGHAQTPQGLSMPSPPPVARQAAPPQREEASASLEEYIMGCMARSAEAMWSKMETKIEEKLARFQGPPSATITRADLDGQPAGPSSDGQVTASRLPSEATVPMEVDPVTGPSLASTNQGRIPLLPQGSDPSRLEFLSPVSRAYTEPPASEASWQDHSEPEEQEEAPQEAFPAQWPDLLRHMAKVVEVPITEYTEPDTVGYSRQNQRTARTQPPPSIPCASETMRWLSQLHKKAQGPSKSQTRGDRELDKLRLDEPFFNGVARPAGLPVSWTETGGPLRSATDKVRQRQDYVAWHRQEGLVRKNIRPLEHLQLVNDYLARALQPQGLDQAQFQRDFPADMVSGAIQAQRACLVLAMRQNLRASVHCTQERRKLALNTAGDALGDKSLRDQLLKAPAYNLETPDLFSGIYEEKAAQAAGHIAQQTVLQQAHKNPSEFVWKNKDQSGNKRSGAEAGNAPPKKKSAKAKRGGGQKSYLDYRTVEAFSKALQSVFPPSKGGGSGHSQSGSSQPAHRGRGRGRGNRGGQTGQKRPGKPHQSS